MKNRNAFFYIIIALALLAVVGLVFFLAPGRTPDTPAVLLPTAAPTEDVNPGEAAVSDTALAVTPATVQTVLATLKRVESYSRTLTVRDFYSGGSRSRSIAVYASPEALRLDISADGSPKEHVLLQNGSRWLWYDGAEGVYTGPAADTDADAYQTILTYEDVLDARAEDILDAGYTEFSGTYCIFVRWRFGTLGYESECYIDLATGLLLGERCYDGSVLIYSMDSSAPELASPDEALFAAP